MKRSDRWGYRARAAGLAMLAAVPLLAGLSCLPRTCTEAELQDLWYEESVVAGDADRIVFERLGYPRNDCIVPRNFLVYPGYPAERTWVRVDTADLAMTLVAPPLPGPTFNIATDGHWAVFDGPSVGTIRWRELDTGEESVIVEGEDFAWVGALSRPYLLLFDSTGTSLRNQETGESRLIDGFPAWDRSLSEQFLVHRREIQTAAPRTEKAGRNDVSIAWPPQQLVLLNLATGGETILEEDAIGNNVHNVHVIGPRVVWLEGDLGTRVRVYDSASGTISTLFETPSPAPPAPRVLVDAFGEPGILIRHPASFGEPETLELLDYGGQSRHVDAIINPHNRSAAFAGPYIVYPSGDSWVIHDTRDDSRRVVEPFAGL